MVQLLKKLLYVALLACLYGSAAARAERGDIKSYLREIDANSVHKLFTLLPISDPSDNGETVAPTEEVPAPTEPSNLIEYEEELNALYARSKRPELVRYTMECCDGNNKLSGCQQLCALVFPYFSKNVTNFVAAYEDNTRCRVRAQDPYQTPSTQANFYQEMCETLTLMDTCSKDAGCNCRTIDDGNNFVRPVTGFMWFKVKSWNWFVLVAAILGLFGLIVLVSMFKEAIAKICKYIFCCGMCRRAPKVKVGDEAPILQPEAPSFDEEDSDSEEEAPSRSKEAPSRGRKAPHRLPNEHTKRGDGSEGKRPLFAYKQNEALATNRQVSSTLKDAKPLYLGRSKLRQKIL